MLKEAPADNRTATPWHEVGEDEIEPALVREELNRIVSSRHFQTSRRSKEFLQYVVNQKLSGAGDLLKERLIGVQIFRRKPDYATGEDPVVRVQAGDVRRRLDLYYADDGVEPEVLIQIPLGSYAPVFRLRREGQTRKTLAREIDAPVHTGVEVSRPTCDAPEDVHETGIDALSLGSEATRSAEAILTLEYPTITSTAQSKVPKASARPEADISSTRNTESSQRAMQKMTVAVAFGCLALVAYLVTLYVHKRPDSAQKEFWLPASLSSKPVLLCLPKPIVYRPSSKLFERYAKSHPNALATREARSDQILPLEPTDTIQWGDMLPDHNSGPGIGGVIAAVNISKLLTEENIRFELRFGGEASYADMRNSPVVIIGAINTEWATQLTAELKFAFGETPGAPDIHELGGAKRIWKMETNSDGRITRDYGLITRQLSGKAGQFVVQVAGITHYGTEGASEILANKEQFAMALRSESISLQKKNLQIVVSTDITDNRAGPPHIVAISSW